jgi:hypothetical protein
MGVSWVLGEIPMEGHRGASCPRIGIHLVQKRCPDFLKVGIPDPSESAHSRFLLVKRFLAKAHTHTKKGDFSFKVS